MDMYCEWGGFFRALWVRQANMKAESRLPLRWPTQYKTNAPGTSLQVLGNSLSLSLDSNETVHEWIVYILKVITDNSNAVSRVSLNIQLQVTLSEISSANTIKVLDKQFWRFFLFLRAGLLSLHVEVCASHDHSEGRSRHNYIVDVLPSCICTPLEQMKSDSEILIITYYYYHNNN